MRVLLLVYIVTIVLLSFNVTSFGISYEYMENNTLRLYPGQNYMFKLVVQNKDEGDVKVNISLDSTIATLEGRPELDIPGKTYDSYVYFNISVPEAAEIGEQYNINYVVSPVNKGEGQVPLAVRYNRGFKVLVVEKPPIVEEQEPVIIPEEPKPGILKWVFIPIILIILAVIVILLWNKSHQISSRVIIRKEPGFKQQYQGIKQHYSIQREPGPVIQSMPIIHDKPEVERLEQPTPKPLPVKQEKIINPHHYFHLRNGKSLKSLEELYSEIKTMSHEEFAHHVNHTKNDFANWTLHILEKPMLATQLSRVTSKHETLELIKNELEQS